MELKSLQEVQVFNDQRFTKRVIFQQGDHVVFMLNFMPGQALPSHSHPGAVVTMLVLEGGGSVTVNGTETEAVQGDTIQLEGEETFSFACSGHRRTSLYVLLNKLPGEQYAREL